jgi:hypothetical protein
MQKEHWIYAPLKKKKKKKKATKWNKYRDLIKKIKMKGENLEICIFLLKVLLILHFFWNWKKKLKKKSWEGSQESALGEHWIYVSLKLLYKIKINKTNKRMILFFFFLIEFNAVFNTK